MSKKTRQIVMFIVVYGLLFWVGFRVGEIYNRAQHKVKVEYVVIPQSPVPPVPEFFYIVRKNDYGRTYFDYVNDQHVIIKIFRNEKLRHLLKDENIKIYTEDGRRLN